MSLSFSGKLGTVAAYSVNADASGNVVLSLSIPVESLINSGLVKAGNPLVSEIVQGLEGIVNTYIAAQNPPAPAAPSA